MKRAAYILLVAPLFVIPTACGSFSNGDCEFGACGDGGASSSSGGDSGGDVIAPPGCDLAKEPKDSPACVDDGVGIFVDAVKGADSAAGTKASPVKSITTALAKAGAKRVYVCKGTYAENVTVTTATSIFGGFSCDAWSYAAENAVRIEGSADGAALTIKGVASGLTISDVQVLGKVGAADGGSSVGAFVVSSKAVRFVRAKLEAQAGGAAKDGVLASFSYPAPVKGSDPTIADPNIGGVPGKVVCPGSKSGDGAKGGNAGFSGDTGTPAGVGGAGGTLGQSCAGTGTGGDGKTGASPVGAAGAAVHGRLSATGFVGESGAKGEEGGPGGGGGGGAGNGGAGGGGGSGGCGGAGGGAGSAGGSSIALLAFESEVSLVATQLVAADGKKGGAGAAGQAGQSAFGLRGNGSGAACSGGLGAPGGNGASGGGGAGGVSAGIVWTGGKEPTRDQDSKITHASGAPALGGDGDSKGKDGVNTDVLPL